MEPEPEANQPGRNFKLTLAYDGTGFKGWQVQPGERTVQGELQAALDRIVGEAPLPQGSGRTDAGVHALAQVASFTLRSPIPAANLQRALNRTLPAAVRILETRTVRSTFHARHSAVAKTYQYRLYRGEICPPFLAPYVYAFPWPIDEPAMMAAAADFLGEHDFTAMAASAPDRARRLAEAEGDQDVPSPVRTIFQSAWQHSEVEGGELLVYRVRGSGFLHHMVRNLVGTMIDVGRGHLGPRMIPALIAARDRSQSGPTAPARGLFLESVEYGGADREV